MSDSALFFILTTIFCEGNEEETKPNKCKAMNRIFVNFDHILDCSYEQFLKLVYRILALMSG